MVRRSARVVGVCEDSRGTCAARGSTDGMDICHMTPERTPQTQTRKVAERDSPLAQLILFLTVAVMLMFSSASPGTQCTLAQLGAKVSVWTEPASARRMPRKSFIASVVLRPPSARSAMTSGSANEQILSACRAERKLVFLALWGTKRTEQLNSVSG